MVEIPKPTALTVAAIYAAYEADQDPGYRDHLGASLVGKDCNRAIWYDWRWATRANHAGRLLRLFQTGNLAEDRFVADLRRIGVTVLDVDPATGRQHSCRDATGHFGGSADGQAIGFPEAPKTWHICEFKTHGAKSFRALQKDGVEKSKPQHWAQMQIYMHLMHLDRAFYLAVNKDNDELYQERVKVDREAAERLVAKAQRIIASPRPPARISDDATYFGCKFCNHSPQCHAGRLPQRHCRSCLHSTPVAEGRWHCARHDRHIPLREQRIGCSLHLYIPDLVRGEQVDAGADWVEYTLADGTTWRDAP